MNEPMAGMNFIGGHWVAGEGSSGERRSPSDDSLVWQGNWASLSQVDDAIDAARVAFPVWSETSLEERMEVCKKFAALVEERRDELAQLIAVENGKPLWEAKTEVAASIAKVSNSIDAIMKRRWTTTEQIGEFMAVTRFRPHGVMFVIGPFNFPSHVPGGHIIPSLLAGNTVLFKPSEMVPATGQWLVKMWETAGLPAGVLNLLQGTGEIGARAVEREDVDGVLFTGSQRVGTLLHSQMAGQPHRVLALEMGGNNPLVIHNTTDFRGAAITTILSAFITAGQRCTCSRRLIVTGKEAHERVVEQLLELVPQIAAGKSLAEPQPFMGPLIHEKAAKQMLAGEAALLSSGGKSLLAMEQDSDIPALVRPALIAMPSDVELEDQEYFGPLLMIQQADDLDHAIRLAGNTKYGLSAGFIGDEVDDFHYFLHRVPAGVINWNRQTTGASGKLPFGGVGLSGNHHPSGFFAADYCSYPIASLESHELSEAKKPVPGLEFTNVD